MPVVTKITSATCKMLSEDIMDALQSVAVKHGLTLGKKGGKYSEAEFTLPITMSVLELKQGNVKADFVVFAEMMGADPDWFNQSFTTVLGERLTIVGLNTRAPKNCIKIENENGTQYKCSPAYVRQFM